MNAVAQQQDQVSETNTENIAANTVTVDGGSGATEVLPPENTSPSNNEMPQLLTEGGRKP